jgi:acetyl-CoA carboxylase carboxyltransferase component
VARNRANEDGAVTGISTVDVRPVAVYSHDFTVFGEAAGEAVQA